MWFYLFGDCLSLSGIAYNPRIVNQDVGEIIRCSFAFLYWSANGAAVCINTLSSIELLLSESCFRSCVSTNEGGSIYFSSQHISLIKCCWEVCYIHNGADNIYGNVIFASAPSVETNLSASIACGPYKSISGDSTYHLKTSVIKINVVNNTNCCSNGGSAGLQVDGLTNTENKASFLNVVNGSSNHVLTVHPNPMKLEVFLSNFISVMAALGHFDSQKEKLLMTKCYIFKKSSSNLVTGSVVFTNCTGNIQYDGIDEGDEIKLIKDVIVEFCGVANRSNSNSIVLNLVCIFLISLLDATQQNKVSSIFLCFFF